MFCAISGKPPKSPVLSPRSKCIFEKDLIYKYIDETGKDPVSNEALSTDELIVIAQTPQQVALANSLNSSTLNSNYSIPNLLSTLQNEWDAIMLENFKLRKQLDGMTKQLSVAFYERDAAKLVAANALREKDELAENLTHLTAALGNESTASDNELTNDTQFLATLLQSSQDYVALTKQTKSKKQELAPIERFKQALSCSKLTLFVQTIDGASLFTTEHDGLCVLGGHKPLRTIDTSALPASIECLTTNQDHSILYASLSNGKIGEYNLAEDKWRDFDIALKDKIIATYRQDSIPNGMIMWVNEHGEVIYTTSDGNLKSRIKFDMEDDRQYTKARLHKDGLLLGLLWETTIEVYNLAQPEGTPTIFETPTKSAIKDFKFSTNGYWMIVEQADSIMAFDLRKQTGTLAVKPFPLTNSTLCDTDQAGQYLVTLDKENLQMQFFKYKKANKEWQPLSEDAKPYVLDIEKTQPIINIRCHFGDTSLAVLVEEEQSLEIFTS